MRSCDAETLQASAGLLSALAGGEGSWSEIGLHPTDFPQQHQHLAQALADAAEMGDVLDLDRLLRQLEQRGHDVVAAGEVLSVFNGQSVPTLVECVRSAANQRRIEEALQAALAAVKESAPSEAPAHVARLESALGAISQPRQAVVAMNIARAGDALVKAMKRAKDNGGLGGLRTGFARLDEITGGLLPGGFHTLGAVTGGGKSSIGTQIACGVSSRHPTLYVSLEMPAEDILAKMISQVFKVPGASIRDGQVPVDKIVGCIEQLTQRCSKLRIAGERPTTLQLVSMIRAFRREIGDRMGLVVIDHVGLVQADAAHTRDREVASIVEDLKAVALQTGLSLLVLAQLSRAANKAGRPPELHDLRDSGTIEQISDSVVFIHREEGATEASLIVRKNRRGRVGTIPARFDLATQTFAEVSR